MKSEMIIRAGETIVRLEKNIRENLFHVHVYILQYCDMLLFNFVLFFNLYCNGDF